MCNYKDNQAKIFTRRGKWYVKRLDENRCYRLNLSDSTIKEIQDYLRDYPDTYIAVNFIKGAKIEVNYRGKKYHDDYIELLSSSGKTVIKTLEPMSDGFRYVNIKNDIDEYFCAEIRVIDAKDNELMYGYPIGYADIRCTTDYIN